MLGDWEWNEVDFEGTERPHEGVVSLLTMRPDGTPALIGTAFIVSANQSHAVAVSAAHNFYDGVHKAQNPNPRHHASALREFLPDAEAIAIDRQKMRAVYQVGERVEACVLGFVAWDKATDLAVLTLSAQDTTDDTVFHDFFRLGSVDPKVGDEVGVLGYADMATLGNSRNESGGDGFTLARRLVLRGGRITAVHPDGHILCRGPCVETTIPVSHGMSGGPCFLLPEPGGNMVPFGLMTSDSDEDVAKEFLDRSRAAVSIISLLPITIANDTGEKREVRFKIENTGLARNPEFDPPTD